MSISTRPFRWSFLIRSVVVALCLSMNAFATIERGFLSKIERPLRFDGRDDVHAFAAGCFDESVIAELLDVLLHIKRQLDDLSERILLGRVEVPHDVVGFVEVRRAAMHLMKLDAREIRQPHQRRFFGREHVIDLVFLVAEHDVFEPRGRPLGTVLLKEGLMIDAVGPAHERQAAGL